jgi:hypothetical protein
MNIIVSYLEQSKIDLAEKLLGRKTTWQERDNMMQRVSTTSEAQAERLVDHFRLSGCIAFIETREE